MWKKIVFYFLLPCIVAGSVFWIGSGLYSVREDVAWEKDPVPVFVPIADPEPVEKPEAPAFVPSDVAIKTVLTAGAPFVSQAPFGDWSNPIYQDACEETSILMAAYFIQGKTLTPAIGEKEILALAEYGKEKFGHFVDTSAEDTAIMLEEYFEIPSEVVYDMKLDDIKRALASKNLIIVPANGRKLGNPNFTPPGPINHMLVITGYDLETKEFITNDPGTRAGKNYRYAEDVLYAAIRDYPAGKHLPNSEVRKAMIVIPIDKQ